MNNTLYIHNTGGSRASTGTIMIICNIIDRELEYDNNNTYKMCAEIIILGKQIVETLKLSMHECLNCLHVNKYSVFRPRMIISAQILYIHVCMLSMINFIALNLYCYLIILISVTKFWAVKEMPQSNPQCTYMYVCTLLSGEFRRLLN